MTAVVNGWMYVRLEVIMELASYAASLVSTILGLCEPFGKSMKTILLFYFLGNLLVGLSYLFILGYSGAAICFVACVQGVINYMFYMKGKKIPALLIAFYGVAFVSINLLTFKAWYDVFSLIAAMLSVLSVAQTNPRYYRVLYVSNSMVWIVYDFLAGAYGNLATHIILFVSTFLAILIRDRKSASKS